MEKRHATPTPNKLIQNQEEEMIRHYNKNYIFNTRFIPEEIAEVSQILLKTPKMTELREQLQT
jgi:hypothetical protein